jgi:hypothetical protein
MFLEDLWAAFTDASNSLSPQYVTVSDSLRF